MLMKKIISKLFSMNIKGVMAIGALPPRCGTVVL